MDSIIKNTHKNRSYYNELYANFRVDRILQKINNLETFLSDATTTDTSWVCMYRDELSKQLSGKRILELGCGDCTNAGIMAALGGEVWANDISDQSGNIINNLNDKKAFIKPIKFIKGDFLKSELKSNYFDLVVGKAFVHHLTHMQEEEFLRKISKILKPYGRVRFVEPAVNSKILDKIRWMVPVQGRPSSLQKKKFKNWLDKDPHPTRDNSGAHYKKIGYKYFENVNIYPLGSLERFHRLFPKAKWNRKFRRWAFKIESLMPEFVQYYAARTQTIDYSSPKNK